MHIVSILLVWWGSLQADFIKTQQSPKPLSDRLNWALRGEKKTKPNQKSPYIGQSV